MRPWEAARLADALAAFDRRAVKPINEWILKHWDGDGSHVETIAQAARVLGLLGETSAETPLIEMLESDRLGWKVAAASALGRIASDTSRGALLRALQDDSWEVRARAVRALASLADGSVAPAIAELLSDSQPSLWESCRGEWPSCSEPSPRRIGSQPMRPATSWQS